jgi:hypothetical protein
MPQALVPSLSPIFASCGLALPPKRTFGKAVQVTSATSPGTYQFEPAGAITQNGDVAVAFGVGVPLGSGAFDVATALVRGDGSVSHNGRLGALKDSHFDPWMTATPGGQVVLVWLGFDGKSAPEKNAEIGVAVSDDGRSWKRQGSAQAPDDCPAGADGCFDKPLIASGRGGLFAAYATDTGGGMRVMHAPSGDRFETGALLKHSGGYGTMFVDGSGALHLASIAGEGQSFGDAKNFVEYARSDDEGRSFSRHRVSQDGEPVPSAFSNPSVAFDEQRGVVYVAYTSGAADGRWDIVLATSADRGLTWKRLRVNDDGSCANHATPSAVVDGATGQVHIVWIENRTGSGGLAYARCEPGGARCSANDSVNDTPFASYSLVRFSPKWMGEYGQLVFDARRRLLHVLWTQPVLEGGEPRARIFYARGAL